MPRIASRPPSDVRTSLRSSDHDFRLSTDGVLLLFGCFKPYAAHAAVCRLSYPHSDSNPHGGRSAHRLQDSASRAADALAHANLPMEAALRQLKGPYRKWIHDHTFEEADSGKTFMRDRVRFALPFAHFGDIALPFVRAEVRGIFAFRRKAILDEKVP
jgi:hypothetical protein